MVSSFLKEPWFLVIFRYDMISDSITFIVSIIFRISGSWMKKCDLIVKATLKQSEANDSLSMS